MSDPISTRPQLRSVSLGRGDVSVDAAFPFNVPAIRTLDTLTLGDAVTFFVGENGSGKSTLMEALAIATRLPTVGSQSVASDPGLKAQRQLASKLNLVWAKRTHRGFFLRAEDFFGFAKSVSRMRVEFQERLEEVERDYADRSALARSLAAGPAAASIHALEGRYGENPDARSHGEAFLALFRSRLVPGGLFLLDEPEAALSPQSQLGLMSMIGEAVREGGQFVIATHSPILMAFPGAILYDFDQIPVRPVAYEDLESIQLTRSFLAGPERFLRHLFPSS